MIDHWDGDGNYELLMNIWWGTNGSSMKLYEDGILMDTKSLVSETPSAQTSAMMVNSRELGTYQYHVVLSNEAGET